MRKYLALTLAVLATASLPSLVLAGEVNQQKTDAAPTLTQMSDSDMDKVTAGRVAHAYGHSNIRGEGKLTAASNHGHNK
jgi:hypothetical protein